MYQELCTKLKSVFPYTRHTQIHNGWKISKDKKTVYNSAPLFKEPKKLGIEDAICGLGINTYTNSFFMRKKVFDTRPEFLKYAPTRDYVMIVECALKGLRNIRGSKDC